MVLESDRVQKPFRQFRKLLKQLSKDPPPEAVHKLRTQARHIEAIAATLIEPDKKTRRLLKSIKPVRKAAGDVRDADVLTGNALSLPEDLQPESLTRLVEHLGVARQKGADALLDTVDRQRKTARRTLKQYAKLAQSALPKKNSAGSDAAAIQAERHVQVMIAGLTGELSRWPALNVQNIHLFRLKVKELRSILQLLSNGDPAFADALGNAKDKIGDWHDWQQLAETAAHVLDARQDRDLLTRINEIVDRKLNEALDAANTLRSRYLQAPPRKSPASERQSPAALHVIARPNQAA